MENGFDKGRDISDMLEISNRINNCLKMLFSIVSTGWERLFSSLFVVCYITGVYKRARLSDF